MAEGRTDICVFHDGGAKVVAFFEFGVLVRLYHSDVDFKVGFEKCCNSAAKQDIQGTQFTFPRNESEEKVAPTTHSQLAHSTLCTALARTLAPPHAHLPRTPPYPAQPAHSPAP